MRSAILTLAVVVALLFAATQMFVPSFLENRLAESLLVLGNGAPVQVHMSSFPAWRMLTGSVERLDVTAANFPVGDLRVDDLQLRARGLDVDVGRLLKGEPLPIRRSRQFSVRAAVTAAELARYVNEENAFPGEVQVEVSPGGVQLRGHMALLNNVVPVTVTGRFEARPPTFIAFIVEDVEVQGASLPAFMVTVIKETYTVRLDLSDGPLPLYVDDVVHEAGRIVVEGRPQMFAAALQAFVPADAVGR